MNILKSILERPYICPQIIERARMQDRPDARLFGQREFRCVRSPELLKTNGFGGCSILFLFNDKDKLRAGAHFDGYCLSGDQVKPSFQQIIIPSLSSVCGNLSHFMARLIGGIPNNERSEIMTEGILSELATLNIDVVELDFGRTCSQGAILGEDNRVYELTHFCIGPEEQIHMKNSEAYYATRNPLLRDACN